MNITRRWMTTGRIAGASAIFLFVACSTSLFFVRESNARPAARVQLATNPGAWVTGWGTSQQALGDTPITNATVRMIARVTIPGDSVRIRLDNTFGTAPVTFGSVTVAPRIQGPAVAAGLNKPVAFSGKTSITIPAGGSVRSDPLTLHVDAQQQK